MKSKLKSIIMVLVTLATIIVLNSCSPMDQSENSNGEPTLDGNMEPPSGGRILYFDQREQFSTAYWLMIMDGEGNKAQPLGEFTGSLAWSHSGKYIAIGCKDPEKLCVLDVETIPDIRSFPAEWDSDKHDPLQPEIVRQLELPQECHDLVSFSDGKLKSISWSFDDEQLVIVCGNQKEGDVCILPLNDEPYCWQSPFGFPIARVVWSPIENKLAISGNETLNAKIYITDVNGDNPAFIADGWSATWSYDGAQLAYIAWEDGVVKWVNGIPQTEGILYTGIAKIDLSNSEQEWIFKSSNVEFEWNKSFLTLVCEMLSDTCRLTWSPDGRYIAFSGKHGIANDWQIQRVDIETGDVVFLTLHTSHFFSEPDWGP